MLSKSIFAAIAVAVFTSSANAAAPTSPATVTPHAEASQSYEVADTRGMDRREDRRDDRHDRRGDRQDCRQSEGVGHDKRNCKQADRQQRNLNG